jgi:prophage regulatory protein
MDRYGDGLQFAVTERQTMMSSPNVTVDKRQSHSQSISITAPTTEGSQLPSANHLPETGFVRLANIIGKPATKAKPGIPAIIPVSKSTWWAGVGSGRYPQPTRELGPRITAWSVESIRALIAQLSSKDS